MKNVHVLSFVYLEFIQMRCTILDDQIDSYWKEIIDSLSRQHIDEENNKKKKIRPEQLIMARNLTPSQIKEISTASDEHQTMPSISTAIGVPSSVAIVTFE